MRKIRTPLRGRGVGVDERRGDERRDEKIDEAAGCVVVRIDKTGAVRQQTCRLACHLPLM